MKRLLLLLLILFVVGGSVFADLSSYPPALGNGGAVMLDFGLGYPWYSIFWSLVGARMGVPPIFLDAAFALPNIPISVGLSTAFWQYKYSGYYTYRSNYLFIGTKADWHFGFDANVIDFYAGLTLGYRVHWWSSNYDSYLSYYSYGGFDYGAHAGAHFYFTPIFGAMAEVGYPFIIKAGLSFKFGGGGGSSSSGSGRYVVDSETLNVRNGPSADNAVVGVLRRGDRVDVLNNSGTWWEIRSGNIRGYVNSTYLRRN
jgi:hypothetical protein